MLEKRLIAIVTGLMLIGGGAGQGMAEPTWEQLSTIDALLNKKDTRGLLNFLAENPQLMQGKDELASELQEFTVEMTSGGSGNLAAYNAPVSRNETSTTLSQETEGEIY